MPALWVEETRRPHSGGRVLRLQRYHERGPSSRPALGSVSSLSPLPRGRGPSIARSSAPAARQLSARSCPGPVVRACSGSKSAAEKDRPGWPQPLAVGSGPRPTSPSQERQEPPLQPALLRLLHNPCIPAIHYPPSQIGGFQSH
ncbi:uncharacterized protein LOC113250039 isoform X6 [Ursus arctos]|uniref:uncharacterized protein LOC113250039 isoform X6 n=1 Tax=Ursus arctos TaxID=9644 RepID=UPI002549B6E4|nr:uncharacterized protein LOC113250039 isoform X6 [Ursus arctos]